MIFKKTCATALIALTALNLTLPARSYGWGSYGHEQVNAAALELLVKEQGIGRCLAQTNRDAMVRLGITPDADWKMLPYESRALKLNELFLKPGTPFAQETLKKELEKEEKAKTKHLRAGLVDALKAAPTSPILLAQMKEDLKGALTNLPVETLREKKIADRTEHSLHFWEGDAYSKEMTGASLAELAGDKAFKNGKLDGAPLALFKSRLMKNASRVKELDPGKALTENLARPSSRDLIQHGTAPWRVQQLYQLAVQSLKEAKRSKDPEKMKLALMYLGTMGHYVGDMGQPFHASLNFDGQAARPVAQTGIHHDFEEQILEDEAISVAPIVQNSLTGLWPDFSSTQSKVVEYAKLDAASRQLASSKPVGKRIVPEIMGLVSSGYDLASQLMDRHAEAERLFPKKPRPTASSSPSAPADSSSGTIPSASASVTPNASAVLPGVAAASTDDDAVTLATPEAVKAFRKMKVSFDGVEMTVLEAAQKRLGQSSALLATLWQDAAKDAGMDDRGFSQLCPTLTIDPAFRAYVIKHYPAPSYHQPPADFNRFPAGAAPKPDVDETGSNESVSNVKAKDLPGRGGSQPAIPAIPQAVDGH